MLGILGETQISKHLRVVMYINSCTNEVTTQSETQSKMFLVGPPKHETILEEKGDFHIMEERKYKV